MRNPGKTALCALALWVAAAGAGAQPAALQDPFTDGSGRTGPALIAVPRLQGDLGSQPEHPGYEPSELLHAVTLSPYAIGRQEVTNADFALFLSEAGLLDGDGIPWVDLAATGTIVATPTGYAPAPGTERRPATGLNWHAARAYAAWLSKKTGQSYELPTAAQWEMAARAGTSTAWWWGDEDDVSRYRSINSSATPAVADVGSYPPNPWGIYDATGNVWEWVLDCYVGDAPWFLPVADPVVLDDACFTPEIRGGSFRDGWHFSRPAYRSNLWWSGRFDNVGFRVARRLAAAPPPPGGVRLRGTVAGAASGSPVRVRLGWGPRVAPMERWFRITGSQAPRDDRMTSSLGIPLPPSPSQWQEVPLSGSAFVTDWFVPGGTPQLVAFDASGRVAVRDIALPSGPGASAEIDIGTLELRPTAGLDLSAALPATAAGSAAGDLPVPILIGIDSAALDAAARADAGLLLSSLDQIDYRMFALLVLGHGYVMSHAGEGQLRYLPPFSSLTLLAHDPRAAGVQSYPVAALAAGSTARLALAAPPAPPGAATPGTPSGGGSLSGRVTLTPGGPPAAGARIVVGDYPARRETTADAEGRFTVSGLQTAGPLTVFVDTSQLPRTPGLTVSQVFRGIDPAGPAELALAALPATPSAGAVPALAGSPAPDVGNPKCTPVNDPQYGQTSWIGQYNQAGKWSDNSGFAPFKKSGSTVSFVTCYLGDWGFYYAATPFLLFSGQGSITNSGPSGCDLGCPFGGCYAGNVDMNPVTQPLAKSVIRFVNAQGFGQGAGASVYFSPPGPFATDYSPTEMVINKDAQIVLCNVNTNPVHVYVPNPANGETLVDCDITLKTVCTVTIGKGCDAIQCQ